MGELVGIEGRSGGRTCPTEKAGLRLIVAPARPRPPSTWRSVGLARRMTRLARPCRHPVPQTDGPRPARRPHHGRRPAWLRRLPAARSSLGRCTSVPPPALRSGAPRPGRPRPLAPLQLPRWVCPPRSRHCRRPPQKVPMCHAGAAHR
eukprot:scaffold18900_cov101-Isochrysis_galbana.AAC.2